MMVTGPSLTRETSIMAPKRPYLTGIPLCASARPKSSTMERACSGGMAAVKAGRFPCRHWAQSVN